MRNVQVTTDELLWIQVRSDDEATARKVLASVSTRGCLRRLRPGQVVMNLRKSASRPSWSTARPETDISRVAFGGRHREPLEEVVAEVVPLSKVK
jgi:hypothetical protein